MIQDAFFIPQNLLQRFTPQEMLQGIFYKPQTMLQGQKNRMHIYKRQCILLHECSILLFLVYTTLLLQSEFL